MATLITYNQAQSLTIASAQGAYDIIFTLGGRLHANDQPSQDSQGRLSPLLCPLPSFLSPTSSTSSGRDMSSKELQAPALPTVSPEHLASCQKKRSANGRRVLALLVGATCATFIHLHGSSIELPNLLWTQAPPLGLPERIQRRWGQYSPYFPAGEYVPPPDGCDIVQVSIVRAFVTVQLCGCPQLT